MKRKRRAIIFEVPWRKIRRPATNTLQPVRCARAIAQAYHLQGVIHGGGKIADRTQMAKNLGFTLSRLSQNLDLLLLAPDIQEEVLFFVTRNGREVVTEKELRQIVRIRDWEDQRAKWKERKAGTAMTSPTAQSAAIEEASRAEPADLHSYAI